MGGYPTHSSLREWSWQPGWGGTCGVVQPGPPPLCPWRGGAPWTAGTCEGEGVANMSQQGESRRMRASPQQRHTEPLQGPAPSHGAMAVEDSPQCRRTVAGRLSGLQGQRVTTWHRTDGLEAPCDVTWHRHGQAPAAQCTSAGGPGGSAHSPGSWPGSRVSWGWPRPTRPCLCFSCLARIRSILWMGDDSEHRARPENTPPHPGPPGGTYCLFSWARDFSSALRW